MAHVVLGHELNLHIGLERESLRRCVNKFSESLTKRESVTMKRRNLNALLAASLLGGAPSVQAQNTERVWPSKPVRFINCFPPGGPNDLMARAVASVLQKDFGQPFVVEYMPGAGGNIGAAAVARADPDGHVWLWGIDTTFTVNPHIYPKLPFKLGTQPGDLKPLVIVGSSGLLIGVNSDRGIKSINEFLEVGKTKGLSLSNGGAGSPGHLAAEVLAETGFKVTHVPYKGNTAAVTAVLSGEVDGGILATPGMLPHIASGRVNALAVTSKQRSSLAPEIPTVNELGFKDLELQVYYLVAIPAAVPDPVFSFMQKTVQKILRSPSFKEVLGKLDIKLENTSTEIANVGLFLQSMRYAKVVKATKMKVE
jgi:tripartite-type tricarboxylate transporter receptor subunit TctC